MYISFGLVYPYNNYNKSKKGSTNDKTYVTNFFSFFLFLALICNAEDAYLSHKHFVIVIPSYNNKQWYVRNLASVLSQNYDNFDVIYTDDRSPDGTGDLVEKYLEEYDLDHRVILIKNEIRRGALHNLYLMINMCPDDAVIVTLDGDDWLPDDEVLTRLNAVYADDVWLTYGQFKLHPSGIQGWASAMPDYIVENNAFRDFQHLPTHLRTFYAWLFTEIKLEDFLYLGQFYPMTWDMVMMFPMIEMAGERHRFIPDIMYIYNDENSISDHHVSRQLQAYLAQIVKQKTRYKRLAQKPIKNRTDSDMQADVIIFAQTPEKLIAILDSLQTYVIGAGKTFVMYRPTSALQTIEYDAIIESYPKMEFHLIGEHRANFISMLSTIYERSHNNYILFSKGDVAFHKETSLTQAITALQETNAYAFYFNLNAQYAQYHYPHLPLVECRNDVFAWNFSLARDKWSSANSLDVVLHKKSAALEYILRSHYDLTPAGLEAVWANEGNLDKIGLCFAESKLTA